VSTLRVARQLEEWFEDLIVPGDLVLTGCSDPTSRLIQFVTRSQFSHVAIVSGERTLIEAYDYGVTPIEIDEGIYETPLAKFYERATLDRVMVRRPVGLDQDTLESALRFALENSPPFPTSGALLTNALIATATPWGQRSLDLLRRLGLGRAVDGFLDGVIGLVADGPERVHCSEIATRLYYAADLHLRFVDPVLLPHFDRVLGAHRVDSRIVRVSRRLRGKIASLDRYPKRIARPGARAQKVVHRGPAVAASSKLEAGNEIRKMSVESLRERWEEGPANESDFADLILPADFERAEPFDTVGLLVRGRTQWAEHEISAKPWRVHA
jgi:hypothetical protein